MKIVVDTNVIVSALLRSGSNPALVVSLIARKEIKLCLSEDIFSEYQKVLARPKFKRIDQKRVKKLLLQMKIEALWVEPQMSVDAIKDDPADNKFLECALQSGAEFIITGNTRHFPFSKFKGSLILTPREFLEYIAKSIFKLA